ncbi:extracellular solute-binding protein [Paenibacillus eucommiae]|uniref:Multiple sugar transport system substrate-binding protein n=1 Tax=Paenibacillus eucommiae TaxID=1355755 RepID=A0ABS4IUF0_9BACL|nr:extracellular solute-binding protein [Paenibacillus eucommiae]MBP1991215.1 multiple sugar transport system substrate-binding protein [Paenibacillus eucommiae]
MNKVEIKVFIDEPWQREAVEAVASRFETKNPEVSVLIEVFQGGEIRNALYTGELKADLVQLFNGDIADANRDGLLLNLQPWMEADGMDAIFHSSILQFLRMDGGITAIPLSATMKGFFYNKKWFDKARIPYPEGNWTWDDFLETALRLQRENVNLDEERFAARISFHREYLGLLLISKGTDWTSPDRTRASGYTNSLQAIEVIMWANDFVRKHRVARATQDYFTSTDLLENKTGMILDYFIMLHENQPLLMDDLGIVGLPYFREGQRINEPWICGFGISSRTKHPEIAWRLLHELTCTNNELTQIVTQGFITPLRSVYSDVGHDLDPMRGVVLAEMAYGSKLPLSATSSYYQLLDEYVNPALARIVFEGADVKETLDELALKLDQGLVNLQKQPV